MEPLNNGQIGTDHFVHYREIVLFKRQKCIATTVRAKKTSTKVPVRYGNGTGNGTVLNGTCRVPVRYLESTRAVLLRYWSGISKVPR